VSTLHIGVSQSGLVLALRRLRDPLLFLALPFAFVALSIDTGPTTGGGIGFDFSGTLWEPARAVLHGGAVYPPATHDAVVIGNPAVYPPPFILAALPLALLPVHTAAWVWTLVLALCVVGALRIVGVRDWRCYVVAATSPIVMHGLYWGNLTLVLLVPVALAWRYRHRAVVVGVAVGIGIAAKLFLWPLLVWLLLTRRFRAAAIACASSLVLVLGSWAVIGFDGFVDYPALMRVVQDVYAVRSFSLATVAAGFGAPTGLAVAVSVGAGVVLLGLAAWLVQRGDGDRRAFALAVAAAVVASPIVWANYAALLFVPIAITWPRIAPAWLLGYPIWLAGLLPKPTYPVPEPCCRPPDVPEMVWAFSHVDPAPWFAAGVMGVIVVVAVLLALARPPAAARDRGRRAFRLPRGVEAPVTPR
jgi:hypothetical protein